MTARPKILYRKQDSDVETDFWDLDFYFVFPRQHVGSEIWAELTAVTYHIEAIYT
jgi:hypothetical protein